MKQTPLHIVTIVKNGWPFISEHLQVFEASGLDWTWHISEGTSAAVNCTSWCRQLEPGLSTDGTKEYIDSISTHPRVRVYRKDMWAGKIEQVNAFRQSIQGNCVVLQCDCDEFYTPEQLRKIVELFDRKPSVRSMRFWCTFLLGPNIKAVASDAWSNRKSEWHRAWRARRGSRFQSHEPPVFDSNMGVIMDREETLKHGISFLHKAYYRREQLAQKEAMYKYAGAVAQWEALHKNTKWPLANLSDYLSWVGPGVGADLYTPSQNTV